MKKIAISLLLVLLAVLCALPIAELASSPTQYSHITQSIDEKTETVLKLTSTSTLLSVGLSVLPDDTASPTAGKLADFSQYFLLILCVLYTEKYMLTLVGLAAFRILIPAALLLLIPYVFGISRASWRLSCKLIVLGLALFIAIPMSIRMSDRIYMIYEESIQHTIASAQQLTEDSSELSEEDTGGLAGKLTQKINELSDKAANLLNSFVESLAVLLVTSCVIPILGLLFVLWLTKLLLGGDMQPPQFLERFLAHDSSPDNTRNTLSGRHANAGRSKGNH